MNLMDLTPMQTGMLKGALFTTLAFSICIGIGLYFLWQWHENEMDKLERDTAMICLDIATEHYEKALRKNRSLGEQQKTL